MSLDKFLNKSAEILQQQTGDSAADAQRGYRLVKASEMAIMSAPDSPKHVTEPRIWQMPTNTPAGIALWEAQYKPILESINAAKGAPPEKKAKDDQTKKPFSIPFST